MDGSEVFAHVVGQCCVRNIDYPNFPQIAIKGYFLMASRPEFDAQWILWLSSLQNAQKISRYAHPVFIISTRDLDMSRHI